MSKSSSSKYCIYLGRLGVTSSNAVVMQNISGTLQKCSFSGLNSLRSWRPWFPVPHSLTLTNITRFDFPPYLSYLILNGLLLKSQFHLVIGQRFAPIKDMHPNISKRNLQTATIALCKYTE